MKPILHFLALALLASTAHAGPAASDMINLAPEQTLRLKVMAEAEDLNGGEAGTCKVFLGFFGKDGKLVGDPLGQIANAEGLVGDPSGLRYAKQVTLRPGQSVELDIQGREAASTMAAKGAAQLLPAIQVQPDSDGAHPCPGVMASVEVLDHAGLPGPISLNDATTP
jgi:hypothetical protein